jgi:predicted nucleic acid-binding protein
MAEMIHVDTSVLVDSLTGPKRSAAKMRRWLDDGERLFVSSVVLYEWLRGPRLAEELQAQEVLFPEEVSVAFGPGEARIAAELYRIVKRPRSREIDIAIAACAITHGAALWTLNPSDFADIPSLTVI